MRRKTETLSNAPSILQTLFKREESRKDVITSSSKEINQWTTEINKLYQHALLTEDLRDIFAIVPKIYAYCFNSKKKKLRKKMKNDFLYWMQNLISFIFKNVSPPYNSVNWQPIFHELCINIDPEKMKYFSRENIEFFLTITIEYLTCIQSDESIQQSNTIKSLPSISSVYSLIKFFQRHKMDVLSCLIGLRARSGIVEAIKTHANTSNNNSNSQKKEINPALLTTNEMLSIIQQNQIYFKRIMQWSTIEDPAIIQRELKEFAGELRGILEIEEGAILLSEIEKDTFVYTRFTGEKKGNCFQVYTGNSELEVKNIRIENLFCLPDFIEAKINNYDNKELLRLVQLPTDTLYHEEMEKVETRLNDYFNSNEIDLQVIKRANNNECSISELNSLTKSKTKLQEIKENVPQKLVDELQIPLVFKVLNIIQNQDQLDLFKPMRKRTLDSLKSFNIRDLITMYVSRYIGVCESALDQLTLQKRDLMNGRRKENLVSWWLDEIDNSVIQFLENLGFTADALPENYIEEEPRDFMLVRENIKIIEEALEEKDIHSLQPFVKEMKDKIYPKIDLFIYDAKIILCDEFKVDLNDENFLEKVKMKYNEEKSNIEKVLSGWIDEIIKDLEYLYEMKELENETDPNAEKSLHIVPISGLVMSVFCRLLNDNRNVLEYWEMKYQYQTPEINDLNGGKIVAPSGDVTRRKTLIGTRKESKSDIVNFNINNNPQNINIIRDISKENEKKVKKASIYNNDINLKLHEYIINSDLNEIRRLLKYDKTRINSVDYYGATPLILSCDTFDYDICKTLLNSNYIDVNIQDKTGATALHYLCKLKVTTENEYMIEDIARLLIAKGSQISILMQNGNSPIHLCFLYDNHSCLKIILHSFLLLEVDNYIWVAIKNHAHRVLELLKSGVVHLEKECIDSLTPFNYALKENHLCCAAILSNKEERNLLNENVDNKINDNNNENMESKNEDNNSVFVSKFSPSWQGIRRKDQPQAKISFSRDNSP